MHDQTCPRCGFLADEARTGPGFPRPGALSRWDNKTIICSACGTAEAVVEWRFGWEALHPRTGTKQWMRVPCNAREVQP